MVGEFLVTRPEDGVVGETPDLFPAASDYHLVCLQHDDSAEMIIDGAQICRISHLMMEDMCKPF
jgi:hypothetical protein